MIVKDISRLGRRMVDVQQLIYLTLPKYNVRLISVVDNFDSKKDEDVFEPFIEIIKNELCKK